MVRRFSGLVFKGRGTDQVFDILTTQLVSSVAISN